MRRRDAPLRTAIAVCSLSVTASDILDALRRALEYEGMQHTAAHACALSRSRGIGDPWVTVRMAAAQHPDPRGG